MSSKDLLLLKKKELIVMIYRQPLIKQIVLYGIIGGGCACLDATCFYICTKVGVTVQLANFIGVNFGIFVSYFLNSKYNFKKTDNKLKRIIAFFSVGYVGLGFSMFILYLGCSIWNKNVMIVKVVSIALVAIVQFLLNKAITFGIIGKDR